MRPDSRQISLRSHERHAIGPSSHGHYHSVDTGKLTMAPRFARLLADRILASGGTP